MDNKAAYMKVGRDLKPIFCQFEQSVKPKVAPMSYAPQANPLANLMVCLIMLIYVMTG